MNLDGSFDVWKQLDRFADALTDHSKQDDLPQQLFHYTSAEGLISIIKSRSLWASDMLCLSDASEAEYANQLILDAVGTNPALLPSEHVQIFKESLITVVPTYTPLCRLFL
jgi:hypothetical protein